MNIEKYNTFTIENKEYYILDKKDYKNNTYIYVNMLEDDDISDNFYVYKLNNNKLEKIEDSIILKEILPLFIDSLEKEVGDINE